MRRSRTYASRSHWKRANCERARSASVGQTARHLSTHLVASTFASTQPSGTLQTPLFPAPECRLAVRPDPRGRRPEAGAAGTTRRARPCSMEQNEPTMHRTAPRAESGPGVGSCCCRRPSTTYNTVGGRQRELCLAFAQMPSLPPGALSLNVSGRLWVVLH